MCIQTDSQRGVNEIFMFFADGVEKGPASPPIPRGRSMNIGFLPFLVRRRTLHRPFAEHNPNLRRPALSTRGKWQGADPAFDASLCPPPLASGVRKETGFAGNTLPPRRRRNAPRSRGKRLLDEARLHRLQRTNTGLASIPRLDGIRKIELLVDNGKISRSRLFCAMLELFATLVLLA